MPYPAAAVGTTTGPSTREVDARWLLAYAAVVDDWDPVLTDTRRPGGIESHPLFPVCLEWPAVLALRDGELGPTPLRDEVRRGVHASHDLQVHRAVRPGEVVTTTATIVAVERRRAGTHELVRLDTVAAGGEPIATTFMGNLFLGVDLDGPATVLDAPPPPPTVPDGPTLAVQHPLPANLGHTYTECARIWNPIHTDPAAAAAAGLPGPILHGTATLAHVVTALRGRLRAPVDRIVARFTGMVQVPTQLALAVRGEGHAVAAVAVGPEGVPVLDDVILAAGSGGGAEPR